MVVDRHLHQVPYQNLHWHWKERQSLPLDFESMADRMCGQGQGGICYEHALLTYYALTTIGFSVKILLSQVLVGRDYQFSQDRKPEHALLLVELEGAQYLVETGFGFKSPRQPLLLDLSKQSQIYEVNAWEHYLLEDHGDNYTLYFKRDNQWAQQHAVAKPLKFFSLEDLKASYKSHLF